MIEEATDINPAFTDALARMRRAVLPPTLNHFQILASEHLHKAYSDADPQALLIQTIADFAELAVVAMVARNAEPDMVALVLDTLSGVFADKARKLATEEGIEALRGVQEVCALQAALAAERRSRKGARQ